MEFTEPVTGFDEDDVTLGGSAGFGSATVIVTGSGASYNIAVSGIDGDGTLTANVDANGASDAAGNGNTASTSTDNTVTYRHDLARRDGRAGGGPGRSDERQPIHFTATFTEPVTGFDETDVVLGGAAGSGSATVRSRGRRHLQHRGLRARQRRHAHRRDRRQRRRGRRAERQQRLHLHRQPGHSTTPPRPSPTLSAPPAFTNDDTPEIAGTAGTQGADSTHSADDDHVTVKVFEGATLLQTHSNVPVDSGDGSFSVDATHLDDGDYTARVEQSDAAGNSGFDERDFEVDTVRPDVTIDQALARRTRRTISRFTSRRSSRSRSTGSTRTT